MTIEVRPAKREELERVNELRRQVNDLHVQGRPGHFRPGFNQQLQRHVYDQFESETGDVLVALADGEVAGFATVIYVHRPEGPYTLPLDFYHVEEFGVDAAHRRQGIGRALVDYMRSNAVERGFTRIDLDAWAFNESALAFYQKVGFVPYRWYFEMTTGDGAADKQQLSSF